MESAILLLLFFVVVQLIFLFSVISMFRKVWLNNALLLKGFSLKIDKSFKHRMRISNRGCVEAVAEWVSRQDYGRDVWRVTLTYNDQQRIITTKTLTFYYGKDRKTGKSKLDTDDLIKNVNSAVIDWGRGSRWKFKCLDDDIPEEESSNNVPLKKYEVISAD